MSVAELHKELRRRERRVVTLMRRRDRAMAKVEKLDALIRDAGGALGRRGRVGAIPGRRRPRNEMNLAESLVQVLKGKTMGVTEVAGEVQKAGYQTTAENFRTIVNQTLIKNRKMFRKVGRGQYTAA
jgi:hypothetical protein